MKTQISLILLGLGLVSASVYASHADEMPMPASNDINLTAPDQSGMWSFGATAVLMQPTNSAFNYADIVSSVDGSTVYKNVDASYHWWFGADITYAFPGNGRDVTLAYEGLHGTNTDSTSVPASTVSLGSGMISTLSGLSYQTIEAKTDTNYDAGDLVFGQKLDVGKRIRLHPFMGLRYAHIDVTDTTYGSGGLDLTGGDGSSVENLKLENTFNGIGPRLGSDAQVNLGQGFSVRGRLGLSALIGSRSIDNKGVITTYDTDGTTVSGTINGSNNNDSETRVIPEIDGRLGLNYTYDYNSTTALGFEAGWQATNYFNVVAEGSSTGQYQDNTNFGVQGPYARVQLDIA
ncbi:MAG: Legionella pneumophila major outer membrane protein precursor [Gammaproteobacteria bacterium]|nr:Legionella pneumophila major outer membrane protein precursor [Gammaproteobacteria bacterium]